MPWLSNKGKPIREETLLRLYEIYSRAEKSHLDSHYKYRNYYATMLSALMAIFMGGMLQFYDKPFAPALFVVLLCIGILSEFGIRTGDRYYKRFLESIVIKSKIEHVIGFENSIKPLKSSYTEILWDEDEHFIPKRWFNGRRKIVKVSIKSSKDFISKRMHMGDNRNARLTFSFFEIVSVILAILSLPILLKNHIPETISCYIQLWLGFSAIILVFCSLHRVGLYKVKSTLDKKHGSYIK